MLRWIALCIANPLLLYTSMFSSLSLTATGVSYALRLKTTGTRVGLRGSSSAVPQIFSVVLNTPEHNRIVHDIEDARLSLLKRLARELRLFEDFDLEVANEGREDGDRLSLEEAMEYVSATAASDGRQ